MVRRGGLAISGETEAQVSGWTVDTLRHHYDQRFDDQEKAVAAALLATKEAILKAEAATEKRFESVNEFRQALSDSSTQNLSRHEYHAQHKALEDKVQDLTNRLNTMQGQTKGQELTIGKIYGAIGALGAGLSILVLIAR